MAINHPALPSRAPVLEALIAICGPDFSRPARPSDTVAGRRATFVAVPGSAGATADLLGLAAQRGLAVLPRGSGSKLDWGTPPPGVDLIIDTARLGGIWNHDVDAMTAEVGAGTPVRALQAALALRGQRLAVDPPSATATVGGMLARNEAGPLTHLYGPPAEQVDALTRVDMVGHPGDAEGDGMIVAATVHLHARPAARRWVTVPVSTPLQVHNLVEETLAQDVAPSAIEVDMPTPSGARTTEQPPGSLAVLLEGEAPEATHRAEQLIHALGATATGSESAPAWWGRYPFKHTDVALRITVPIADLHAAVYALSDANGGPVPIRGSAGAGTVHAVLPGTLPPDRLRGILETVRQILLARDGRVVAVAAPPEIARVVGMATRSDFF